jgi:hypothetical protein
MRKMALPGRQNKFVLMALAVALSGIWGTIGYQVFHALNGEPEKEARGRPVDQRRDDSVYVYRVDSRDPFLPSAPKPKAKPIVKKEEVPWSPPPLKLTGIVAAGPAMSAVIEDSAGNVTLLRSGETINGVKIIDVRARRVLYSYMRRQTEWVLEDH